MMRESACAKKWQENINRRRRKKKNTDIYQEYTKHNYTIYPRTLINIPSVISIIQRYDLIS
jgi:hypothetical protein